MHVDNYEMYMYMHFNFNFKIFNIEIVNTHTHVCRIADAYMISYNFLINKNDGAFIF